VTAWIVVTPLRAALASVSSSARAFTSTAQTRACGDRNASVSAIAPLPQPRSSSSPAADGGGASRSSRDVPVSRCPWLNTPRSVAIVNATSGSATSTIVTSDATSGRSSK
jgi:hypothetical protein